MLLLPHLLPNTLENVIVLGLIAYRIWSVESFVRTSESRSNARSMPVVAVIVESAATITGMLLITLVAFLTKSGDVQTIVMDSLGPVIGIAFSLIIIRVGLGLATTDRAQSTRLSRSLDFGEPVDRGGGRGARARSSAVSEYEEEDVEDGEDTANSENENHLGNGNSGTEGKDNANMREDGENGFDEHVSPGDCQSLEPSHPSSSTIAAPSSTTTKTTTTT